MWIQLPDGKYGRIEEIVDITELQNEKTLLESKRDLKRAEFDEIALTVSKTKDPDLQALLSNTLDDASAPVVNLENDINNIQGKLEEILAS